MNNLAYKYISTISFSDLYNWSFQYAQKCENLFTNKYKCVPIGSFLVRIKDPVDIEDNQNYKRVSIKLYNGGITLRDIELGVNIGTKKQFRIKQGHFLLSKIDARNGAIGIVPESCNDAIITGNFWDFEIDTDKADPQFLSLLMTTDYFIKLFDKASNGTTNRHYLQEDLFLKTEIPLPSLDIQKEFVKKYNDKIKLAYEQEQKAKDIENSIEKYWNNVLYITQDNRIKCVTPNCKLNIIQYKDLNIWSFDKNMNAKDNFKSAYPVVNIEDVCDKITDGTHQTPKYEISGVKFLSAKDVTSKKIDINNVKYIGNKLHEELKKRVLPKRNDILLAKNGTTGVAAIVDLDEEFSIYVSLALLRPNTKIILPKYLLHFVNSQIAKNQFDSKLIGIGVPNLHLSEIKKTKIVLPNKNIQNEIVSHIDKLNEKIMSLREQAEQNRIAAQEEFEKELFE